MLDFSTKQVQDRRLVLDTLLHKESIKAKQTEPRRDLETGSGQETGA